MDNQANLMLLHPNCHQQIHALENRRTISSGQTGLRGGLSRVWGDS
jgi:hypothetical protein